MYVFGLVYRLETCHYATRKFLYCLFNVLIHMYVYAISFILPEHHRKIIIVIIALIKQREVYN